MWDDVKALNAAAATLAALAALTLAIGSVVWTARRPLFAFREVVFTAPLRHADAAHVEAVVRGELSGTFFTLDFDASRAAFLEVPWVKRVALRRQWPSRLEITLDEYEPLARWNDAALVDGDGNVFVAEYDGELPQLRGPDGRAADVVARYRRFAEIVAPLGLALTGVRLTPRGSWALDATHAKGPLVIELGRGDVEERLARMAGVYARTLGALVASGKAVDYVDLRYRTGFAARVPGLHAAPARKAA
jgi:cell division protein FtsQ